MLHDADIRVLQALFTLRYLANQVIFFHSMSGGGLRAQQCLHENNQGGKSLRESMAAWLYRGNQEEQGGT